MVGVKLSAQFVQFFTGVFSNDKNRFSHTSKECQKSTKLLPVPAESAVFGLDPETSRRWSSRMYPVSRRLDRAVSRGGIWCLAHRRRERAYDLTRAQVC